MITVHDNGGKTADRYTVVVGDDVYTMSADADMPNGVNMYAGAVADLPPCNDPEVPYETLSAGVQRAIASRTPKTHVTRHDTQCGIETVHYASTLKQAAEYLIDMHANDCLCGSECEHEPECNAYEGAHKCCPLGEAVKRLEAGDYRGACDVLEEYGDWSLIEEHCPGDCENN